LAQHKDSLVGAAFAYHFHEILSRPQKYVCKRAEVKQGHQKSTWLLVVLLLHNENCQVMDAERESGKVKAKTDEAHQTAQSNQAFWCRHITII
jgi:hypothetical protein